MSKKFKNTKELGKKAEDTQALLNNDYYEVTVSGDNSLAIVTND